jgi:hypothetical protein
MDGEVCVGLWRSLLGDGRGAKMLVEMKFRDHVDDVSLALLMIRETGRH